MPLESSHQIVFVVHNPADRPLVIRTIRGDCECISVAEPPAQIGPNQSARITVTYVAPKTPMEYESRVIMLTDNPARRTISLRVRSSAPRQSPSP